MINTLTHVDAQVLSEIAEEKKIRETTELFLMFPMGSQFDHLIKLTLDRLGVYCLVADPVEVTAADVKKLNPVGIIVSGGPTSVHTLGFPFDMSIFDLKIPTLGICLGFQMWSKHVGGDVISSTTREYGIHPLQRTNLPGDLLFEGFDQDSPVLQSHTDKVVANDVIEVLASTQNTAVAAGHYEHLWGVQFHPEVTASKQGDLMFSNFCFNIAGAKDRFPAKDVAISKVEEIKKTVGEGRVLLALSGGSDSSVMAGLLDRALKPEQIRGVYIRGIDRPDDEAYVRANFANLDLVVFDATEQYLKALSGKVAMLDKRIAMRGVYKHVLEGEAAKFEADFIAQGTLYTDLVESGGGLKTSAKKAQIKLHHNTNLEFKIAELTPLDDCVKDTARAIGRSIGVKEDLLVRHPFPGPGLVVRIEGEVTAERLHIARQADGIFIEALRKAKLYGTVWQAGAVVTQSEATFSKGDMAGSGIVLALWAVWSVNGFTAEWAELPHAFLRAVSLNLTNEIPELTSVVYRISDKPPATVEWG